MNFYDSNDKKRLKDISKDYRSSFRRDYARLLHSPAFRRLQGKTQLFPGNESDFFRNRLTHSLEVAQVGRSIVQFLNEKYGLKIDEDLVEFAGLAHDLGHPPFGHNGEKALDYCMRDDGGFEGNAQTFRVLTKIEKKEKLNNNPYGIDDNGDDQRLGLNLTYRSLASILKYDNLIESSNRIIVDNSGKELFLLSDIDTDKYELLPNRNLVEKSNRSIKGFLKLQKGYYEDEKAIVDEIKTCLLGNNGQAFKTVECQIMDIADDIAYSTYDLEDAFKANFLTPFDLVFIDNDTAKKISKKLSGEVTPDEVKKILLITFGNLFDLDDKEIIDDAKIETSALELINKIGISYGRAQNTGYDGYERVNQSSSFVTNFIKGIELEVNEDKPVLSKIIVDPIIRKQIEVLKHFTYLKIISTSMLKVSENRGYDIVKDLFDIISKNPILLPEDYQKLYNTVKDKSKKRIICDFIAGMTDRYALEFHARLFSYTPESIFKPL